MWKSRRLAAPAGDSAAGLAGPRGGAPHLTGPGRCPRRRWETTWTSRSWAGCPAASSWGRRRWRRPGRWRSLRGPRQRWRRARQSLLREVGTGPTGKWTQGKALRSPQAVGQNGCDNPMLGRPLEKGRATHASVLAWRIPQTVQSMGSQRGGHDWAAFTPLHFHAQPTWGLEKTTCTDLQVTSLSESTRQPSYQEKRRRRHLQGGGMWSLTEGYRTGVATRTPLLPQPWDPGEAPVLWTPPFSLTRWKGEKT